MIKEKWVLLIFLLVFISCKKKDVGLNAPDLYELESIDNRFTFFGGNGSDQVRSAIKVEDGYILVGNTSSNSGDFPLGREYRYDDLDAFIIKLNNDKKIQWVVKIGENGRNSFEHVFKSESDRFRVVGYSKLDNNDYEFYLYEFDLEGSLHSMMSLDKEIWQYFVHVGGYWSDNIVFFENSIRPQALLELKNGEMLITNHNTVNTLSYLDNDLKPYFTSGLYGGGELWTTGMLQDTDGSILVSGNTNMKDGVFDGMHEDLMKGKFNAFLAKYDSEGNIIWLNSYGGRENDEVQSLMMTENGNYLMAGINGTNDGDFEGMGGDFQRGINQFFLIKISPDGETIWKKTFWGESDYSTVLALKEINNGFAFIGLTNSYKLVNEYISRLHQSDNVSVWSNYPVLFIAITDSQGNMVDYDLYSVERLLNVRNVINIDNERLVLVGNADSYSNKEIFFLELDLHVY